MVYSYDVEELCRQGQTLFPPIVDLISLFAIIPIIERIAPELTVGRKFVGRTSRDLGGRKLAVKLEHVGVTPDVTAIVGDVDRHISDYLNTLHFGIALERKPLSRKKELKNLMLSDLFRKPFFRTRQSVLFAIFQAPLKARPALATTFLFDRRKK